MSHTRSEGSQYRPWQSQSHSPQCSQLQLAVGDGGRRIVAGNGVGMRMGASLRSHRAAPVTGSAIEEWSHSGQARRQVTAG